MNTRKSTKTALLLGLAYTLGASLPSWAGMARGHHDSRHHFKILHHQKLDGLRFDYREKAHSAPDTDEPTTPSAAMRFQAYGKQFDMDMESNEHLLDHLPREQRKRLKQSMQFYKGRLNGVKDSWVRVNRTGNRVTGAFWDGHELYILDNSDQVSKNMDTTSSVEAIAKPYNLVYKLADTQENAQCAVEAQPGTNSSATTLVNELQAQAQTLAQTARQLDLTIVTDAEFTQANSANPQAAVMARMNVVDGIYSEQIGVHLNISEIRPLASNGGLVSTSANGLLDQFASFVGNPGFNNPGLAHLFTGRDLDGSTVGIGYLSVLCNKNYGIGLSQTTGSGIAGALTVAHELGHNFGAPHDGESGSACASATNGFIMNSVLNGSTQFSSCSLQQIAPNVSNAACLVDAATPTPSADLRPVLPVNPVSVKVNNNFNFTVEVTNPGNATATGSTAKITLPAGLSINTVSTTAGSCQTSGLNVSCGLGNLAAGNTATIKLNLKAGAVAANLVGKIQVAASNDTNTGNNAVNAAINISAAPTIAPQVLFQSGFNANNGGFVYLDDAFRATRQPNYAAGNRIVTAGDGKLQVKLGGPDALIIKNMSGGWRKSFTLTKAQTVSLSFEYKVDQTPHYESNEWSDALLSLDGRLIGLNGGDFLSRVTGDGEEGAIRTSGKMLVTITRGPLAAGTHTLILGGFNNQKTSSRETTTVTFDNVKLIAKP